MVAALADRRVGRWILPSLRGDTAFAMLEWTLALFLFRRFGYQREQAGYVFAYMGIILVLVQGGLVGRLREASARLPWSGWARRRWRSRSRRCPGLAPCPVSSPCSRCLRWGTGCHTPALSSLTSRGVSAGEQGATLGAAQGFSSLARAAGPIVGGGLFDRHLAWPFLAAASLMLVAFALSLRTPASRPLATNEGRAAPARHSTSRTCQSRSSHPELLPTEWVVRKMRDRVPVLQDSLIAVVPLFGP